MQKWENLFSLEFLEPGSATAKLKEIRHVGQDDEGPREEYFFVGHREKKKPKPKVMKRIAISLTPQLFAYVRLFYPSGRFISECIRRVPEDLLQHYQRKEAKEKRPGIKSKSTPFEVTPEAYDIFQSIPKRLRSAFVRDCIRTRPSFSGRVLKDVGKMFEMIDEPLEYNPRGGGQKGRPKKKK